MNFSHSTFQECTILNYKCSIQGALTNNNMQLTLTKDSCKKKTLIINIICFKKIIMQIQPARSKQYISNKTYISFYQLITHALKIDIKAS